MREYCRAALALLASPYWAGLALLVLTVALVDFVSASVRVSWPALAVIVVGGFLLDCLLAREEER